jgi:hypothetical protein
MTPSAPDRGALQDAIAGDVVLPGSIHPPSGKDARRTDMLLEYKNAAIHGTDGSIGDAVGRPPPERGPRPSSPGAPGSLGAVSGGCELL